MTADLQVKVDGRWLTSIAPWGGLSYSTIADGGCDQASWSMPLDKPFRHPALTQGKRAEIRVGPGNVFGGRLTEPQQDDDGWTFHAEGLHTAGLGFIAFDGSLNTTSTPDVAVDQAIARGLAWTRPTSLSNSPFVDAGTGTTDDLLRVSELLDRWATSVSKRWGVNPDGAVYAATDPTTPVWHMTPGSGAFGYAEEDYASDVYLRYYDTSFVLQTAHASDPAAAAALGTVEEPVDGRDLGGITGTKATSYVQGLLDKGKARLAWTNAVSPSRWQLTTPGGTPACLPLVKAQQMVRLFGLTDPQGRPLPYVDFVIGRTIYDAGADALTIEPVGLAPRNLTDVLAATEPAA